METGSEAKGLHRFTNGEWVRVEPAAVLVPDPSKATFAAWHLSISDSDIERTLLLPNAANRFVVTVAFKKFDVSVDVEGKIYRRDRKK